MPLQNKIEQQMKEFEKEFHFSDADNPINIQGTELANELRQFISTCQQELIQEVMEMVRGKKRTGNPEFETNQDFGYNQALSDIIAELKGIKK